MILIKALEEKIVNEGEVFPGNVLKVGSFLNQQIDTDFMTRMGEEGARLYKDAGVTKVLTVEASGIAYAVLTAQFFNCPVVFAKKKGATNQSSDVYFSKVHSFTHGNDNFVAVDKSYLQEEDRVLLMDDFLAHGEALRGMADIVRQAGATVVGAACAIEKGFQGGGDNLRQAGMEVYSQAIVESMGEAGITFRKQ